MSTIKMNEENVTYKRDSELFLKFNEEQNWKSLPRKSGNIKKFLEALKNGYPNNKPKAQGTCRAKLMAIKNLYKLNEISDIDFDGLSKVIPTLYEKEGTKA